MAYRRNGNGYSFFLVLFAILSVILLSLVFRYPGGPLPDARRRIYLAFVQHLNLHWGEWGEVNSSTRILRARDYSRYFSLLLRHPAIRHTISMPYWSLMFFERYAPDAVVKLEVLVERGQVEIIDESWSPAVLPLHRLLTQEELLYLNKRRMLERFGVVTRGVFLQESAASEATPYLLSKLGYEWTCLFQFGEMPSVLVGPDGSKILNLAPAISTYSWYRRGASARDMYMAIVRAAEKLESYYYPAPPLVIISGDFEAALPSHTGVSLSAVEEAFELIEKDSNMQVVTASEYIDLYYDTLKGVLNEVECSSSTWADDGHMIIWTGDPYDVKIAEVLLEAEGMREVAELLISLLRYLNVSPVEEERTLASVLPRLLEATGSDGEGWNPTCVFREYIYGLASRSRQELFGLVSGAIGRLAESYGEDVGGEDLRSYILFNSLPYPRQDWVLIRLPEGRKPVSAFDSSGVPIPFQVVRSGEVLLRIFLGPLELRTVFLGFSERYRDGKAVVGNKPEIVLGENIEMANGLVRVRIDPERGGAITGIGVNGATLLDNVPADSLFIGGRSLGKAAGVEVLEEGPLTASIRLHWRYEGLAVDKIFEMRAGEPLIYVTLGINFTRPTWMGRGRNPEGSMYVATIPRDMLGSVATYTQVAGGFIFDVHPPRLVATPMRWHGYQLRNGSLGVITLGGLLVHGAYPSILLGKSTTRIPCEIFSGSYTYRYVLYPSDKPLSPMGVAVLAQRLHSPVMVVESRRSLSLIPPVRLEYDPGRVFINYFTLERFSATNLSDGTEAVRISLRTGELAQVPLGPWELYEGSTGG